MLYMYTVVYVTFFVTVLGHQNCDRASKPLVKSQLLLSKVHWTPVFTVALGTDISTRLLVTLSNSTPRLSRPNLRACSDLLSLSLT